jgi:phosphohistidine phosphatase
MRRLFLLRHGSAQDRAEGRPDQDRQLVEKGRRQCEQVARLLYEMEALPSMVISSPWTRAAQTAAEVLRALNWTCPIVDEDRLRPGTPVGEAVEALMAVEQDCMLAVGHEPLLSSIAAVLISDGPLNLELRKGGIIEILFDPLRSPPGVLLGLLRPKHLGWRFSSNHSRGE